MYCCLLLRQGLRVIHKLCQHLRCKRNRILVRGGGGVEEEGQYIDVCGGGTNSVRLRGMFHRVQYKL